MEISNHIGLLNTVPGSGTITFGDYSAIAWTYYTLYLNQKLDLENGQGYLDICTIQLMSVPYSHLSGNVILKSPNGTNYHVGVDDNGTLLTVPHIAPESGFYANVITGEAPLLVTFTDSSLKDPGVWQWDFGDGNTSCNQSSVHEYTTAGIYTVALTVSNAYGTDCEIKADYIEVSSASDVCPATITDIDGNTYNTVIIGTLGWMMEDLKVTHYPNGDVIPYITSNAEWGALGDNNSDDAYCFYNNNASRCYLLLCSSNC